MTRTRERITFRCEAPTSAGTCPVRFSWLGPAREKHRAEDERADMRSALDKAVELGWSFEDVQTLCPRHARPANGDPADA